MVHLNAGTSRHKGKWGPELSNRILDFVPVKSMTVYLLLSFSNIELKLN